MRYELKNVHISSYNLGGASSSTEPPTVNLTLAYEPIKISYSSDEFAFTNTGDNEAKPNFQSLQINPPPKPPSQPLPAIDDLVFVGNIDVDPLAGLLLPAVQAAKFTADETEVLIPILDDFIFG